MVAVYALLGILAGALVNFFADQFPYDGRLHWYPRCPYCDQPRALRAWVSALTFLQFKPQCQHCGAPPSLRSPLVEVGMAALFALLWQRFGPSTLLGLYSTYSTVLVLVLVIDLEHYIIPNSIIYPALGLGLLGSLLHPAPAFPRTALVGGLIGFGLMLIAYWLGQLFVRVSSRHWNIQAKGPALGFGDVKLGGFVGLIMGVPQVFLSLALAILLGGLIAGLHWFVCAVILRRYIPLTALPYGPYLVAGALTTMLFAPEISRWLLIG